jgi:hypothetical protein
MVNYQPSDLLAMDDFELSWRITDARWSSLPKSILDRIKPLSLTKSKDLFEGSPLSDPLRSPPDFGQLRPTRHQSLEESGTPEDNRIQQWFDDLPVDRDREVYLCWAIGDGVAAVPDWGTFLDTWRDLWYPFDRMCVFDDTREWVVLFGPEEEVLFLERSASQARA